MNTNDKIKAFIQQHRDAFDVAVPGAHGWKSVERALERLAGGADGLERELLLHRVLLDTEDVPARVWFAIEAELDARCAEASAPDPLEAFIRANRDDFDTVDAPARGLWGSIVQNLPAADSADDAAPVLYAETGGRPHRTAVIVPWFRAAARLAAAVALLVAGVGIGIWYARTGQPDGMAMSQVSNEYAELERYYQREITNQQAQLASFTGSKPTDVLADLQQLDVIMEELRRELADVPPGNREQVVRAMIENYKAKTAILERVLERLEPTKTDSPQRELNHDDVKSL